MRKIQMSILIRRLHQSLVHERFIKTLKEINNIFNNFLSDDPSKQLFSLQPRLLSVVSKKQMLNSVAYNHHYVSVHLKCHYIYIPKHYVI